MHAFTTSQVLPINVKGKPTVSFDASGRRTPAGRSATLPLSTIYGFNGTFPGPRINAEYGKPCLVRFDEPARREPAQPRPAGLRLAGLVVPRPTCTTATRRRRATATRTTACGTARRRPATAQAVGRQPVPELARRRRRPGEAELLLVPRPPDGSHRLERLQGDGRAVPDLRPEERHGHGRRAPGPPAARRAHRQPRRLVRRRVRHPARAVRLPPRRRRHHPQGHPRRQGRVPRRRQPAHASRSGGARRSSSTSPTTGSSATSSPSTAPPTPCCT